MCWKTYDQLIDLEVGHTKAFRPHPDGHRVEHERLGTLRFGLGICLSWLFYHHFLGRNVYSGVISPRNQWIFLIFLDLIFEWFFTDSYQGKPPSFTTIWETMFTFSKHRTCKIKYFWFYVTNGSKGFDSLVSFSGPKVTCYSWPRISGGEISPPVKPMDSWPFKLGAP